MIEQHNIFVLCHKMLVFPFLTLEQHTTFKESMINRLSNLINRYRSAAKISQVLGSTIHAKSKGPFISIYKTWRNFKNFFLPRELWVCLFEPINSSADCLAGLSETLTVKNCPRLRLVFRFTVKIENTRQRDQSEEKKFQAKSRISSV